jgi:Zn-dependent protease
VFFGVNALFTIPTMYRTDSLLTFSFPMGRLMGVPLRLSFLMPVVAVALMWRMQDVVFGAITSAILLLSLLAHEIAHLLVARRNYSAPGLVVLWPLGGMSEGGSRLTFRESLAQSLAGPLVNAAVAIACGWRLHELGLLANLLNPFEVFSVGSQLPLAENCLRVTFLVNYCLTLFNLIPVRPLDVGQVASSFLNLRFVESETHDLMLRIGLVVSLFGILAGFVFDISSLVALSAFLLVLHIHQVSQWTPPPEPDDSFLGYDFSEGYTSLNRTEFSDRETEDEDSGFGILERWKTRRDDERAVRESEVREMDEQQLDIILEKLHTEGRDSLSARELAILNRVSARLRQRNAQQ